MVFLHGGPGAGSNPAVRRFAVAEPWWDEAYMDVSASATGLLAWRILGQLEIPLDRFASEAIFTALVTDTGWFRYSNTDAETLRVAAELIEGGLPPAEMYRDRTSASARVMIATSPRWHDAGSPSNGWPLTKQPINAAVMAASLSTMTRLPLATRPWL